jgi:outer membrane receptor protein involved in Fe transport
MLLLISFFAFAATNSSVWAANLEGTVVDPVGKAVTNARVTLLRSLVVIDECQTDTHGVYRFEGIKNGTYQLTASAPGLSGSTIGIDFNKAETRKQDIRLELSALSSQVVVSASLGGALVPEIGSSVSVISQQDIDDRQAQNLLEVIRGIPGIEVQQTGRRGGLTSIFIRGGEPKYNAIMVDGIPMNDFGGDFDMASMPADGIERVEVTRGPQSALYGSNAVAGVINIISQRGEGAPRFTALAEGGSNSTRRFTVGGNGLSDGLSWSFNVSRLDSDGVVANDDYRNQSAFLSLGYRKNSQRQVDFHFYGNANRAGLPGPYGSDPNGYVDHRIDTESRGRQNQFGYQISYVEQLLSRVRQITTIDLATNDFSNHDVAWGDSFSENLRGVFNTRSEINISTRDSLAAGFEFNREQIRNTYVSDSNGLPFLIPRISFAYFAENRWNPLGRLYLNTGIRIDNLHTHAMPADYWGSRPNIPATSITKINPRISAAYIPRESGSDTMLGGTRIHGSFGTGIRPPSGTELISTNPSLKPEKNISFDAGIEQKFFVSRAIVDLTYFYNRFEDQIVTLGGSLNNLSSYTTDNLKNSKAQGLELSVRVHPLSSLELSGEYTFLDSEILALDGTSIAKAPFVLGQQLIRRPRHSGSYSLTWRYRKLTLDTTAYIRGITIDLDPKNGTFACSSGKPCFFDNPGYARADAGISYRLPYGMEIYGHLNNFLNRKYEEAFGYPSLRLNFMAGMRFRFSAE